MDVTIMNPGVIAPSQIPRNARHAKNPPKFVAAAWQSRAIAQTRMLILKTHNSCQELLSCGWTDARRVFRRDVPHPLADWQVLKREVLWPFKSEEIDRILDVLERQKSLLQLAMQNDHM